MSNTGLYDSYGNSIENNDTILWTYRVGGYHRTPDNKEMWVANLTEKSYEQIISYESKGGVMGYFFKSPIGTDIVYDTIKCKVIKKGQKNKE